MASGITRRIDELGRIVIPKEFRNELRIRNGDNLEIKIDQDSISLKKFSNLKKVKDLSDIFIDVLYSFLKTSIVAIDSDNVISASKDLKKRILNKPISEKLYRFLLNKNFDDKKSEIEICKDCSINTYYYYNYITLNGDIIGLILLLSDNIITIEEINIIDLITKILSKYLEE